MIVDFYGCRSCGRVMERRQWVKKIKCPKCGNGRLGNIYLGKIQLLLFLIFNPQYLLLMFKEK